MSIHHKRRFPDKFLLTLSNRLSIAIKKLKVFEVSLLETFYKKFLAIKTITYSKPSKL